MRSSKVMRAGIGNRFFYLALFENFLIFWRFRSWGLSLSVTLKFLNFVLFLGSNVYFLSSLYNRRVELRDFHFKFLIVFKAIGGVSGSKKSCLIFFKDLNEPEILLFTECQNSIMVKSYCNFNFGNLVGSLINLRTKMKF